MEHNLNMYFPDKEIKFVKVEEDRGITVYFKDNTYLPLKVPERQIWVDFDSYDPDRHNRI